MPFHGAFREAGRWKPPRSPGRGGFSVQMAPGKCWLADHHSFIHSFMLSAAFPGSCPVARHMGAENGRGLGGGLAPVPSHWPGQGCAPQRRSREPYEAVAGFPWGRAEPGEEASGTGASRAKAQRPGAGGEMGDGRVEDGSILH